jgi:hypothetical protein
VHLLRNDGNCGGLSSNPGALRTGLNSGYQALGLAVAAGAARVVLVGYDLKYSPDGRSHWHNEHPFTSGEVHYKSEYAKFFNEFVSPDGVEVFNSSLDTYIKNPPRAKLEDVL